MQPDAAVQPAAEATQPASTDNTPAPSKLDLDLRSSPRPNPTVHNEAAPVDLKSHPAHPLNTPLWQKWTSVLILTICSGCVTCTSSLYASTILHLMPAFGLSRVVATLGLSLFVMGLGISPMVLAPLSETYGRRPIYIVSFAIFALFILPCALSTNAAVMLVFRFLDGLAGGTFLSITGGTISDLFPQEKLSAPMMIFTAGPFLGPVIGPLVGGFINDYPALSPHESVSLASRWRWSFWCLLIWAAVMLVLLVLFVPETHHAIIKQRILSDSEKGLLVEEPKPKQSTRDLLRMIALSCTRPFDMMLFEPMVLLLSLITSFLLGLIYLFFGSFPYIFDRVYGFSLSQTGLAFLGLTVGMILGIASDPLWKKYYMKLVRVDGGGVSEPEYRLPPSIAGAILVPLSLFGFAWTLYTSVHWIVPIIFSVFFGAGNILCFSGIYTFLVQCYPHYAASALAANGFMRSSFAAAFPLFGLQMFKKLGPNWGSCLLAFIGLALAPFPYIFFKHGKSLRRQSKYAYVTPPPTLVPAVESPSAPSSSQGTS